LTDGSPSASTVVVDDLDVVAVGVMHKRAVVARVIDDALARWAMIRKAGGERGGMEGPHGGVRVGGERQVHVLAGRLLITHKREAVILAEELHSIQARPPEAQAGVRAIVS
jgi:hypothetical protein